MQWSIGVIKKKKEKKQLKKEGPEREGKKATRQREIFILDFHSRNNYSMF